MCELQDGQIVDVAAPETCCFRLHSKHSTTRLVWRFQKSSSFPKIDEEVSGAGASSVVRSFRPGFGANGAKERPHWRQIELTVRTFRTDFCRRWIGHCMLAETFLLRAHSECRLDRLARPHNFRARCRFGGNSTGGDFRFPDKGCPLFNHKAGCFEISLQYALGF